jgi:hypothetical protein
MRQLCLILKKDYHEINFSLNSKQSGSPSAVVLESDDEDDKVKGFDLQIKFFFF